MKLTFLIGLLILSSCAHHENRNETRESLFSNLGTGGSAHVKEVGTSSVPTFGINDVESFDGKISASQTYLQQGNYEEAINFLIQAEKIDKTALLYEYFGDCYMAERFYQKSFDSYVKSFDMYIKDKNFDKAEKLYYYLENHLAGDFKKIVSEKRKILDRNRGSM